MVIGRADTCDIVIRQPFISSRHCVLKFERGAWMIEDLQSRNGTAVNDRLVPRAVLRSGDTISVAKRIRFVIEFDATVEANRFSELSDDEEQLLHGDDRSYREHGPATTRLEPHDKDVWSDFEK
jgi:pSer/pThr/pTyr-binding forkhead associated (FHA) protein